MSSFAGHASEAQTADVSDLSLRFVVYSSQSNIAMSLEMHPKWKIEESGFQGLVFRETVSVEKHRPLVATDRGV